MGKTEIIQLVLILIPFACFLSAGRARSRVAYWILRVGGLLFALAMALSVLAQNLCSGSLGAGLGDCAAGLTGLFQLLGPMILTGVTAMLSVGPILLIAALLIEAVHRHRHG
ncbi:hypothetical protein [Pseudooceanicola onchidii]|uniref:hypothetical protein n=1 Tax=Pseudooceanicola onchidii TaxID=2562279 RepID=UPI0010A99A1A|nr:hypothetical protein [Pseudooceanicola onchidii]